MIGSVPQWLFAIPDYFTAILQLGKSADLLKNPSAVLYDLFLVIICKLLKGRGLFAYLECSVCILKMKLSSGVL